MKIPEYQQQVDIQQTATPQVQMENFTGGWKNATEAFATLDDSVKQLKKVRDFNEQTDATLGLEADIDAIKSQAANEQDPSKASEYRAKIDEAISKHSSKISDKLLQKEMTAKFQLSGYNTFSAINNDFRKKEIQNGQAKFLTIADKYARSYAEASDDTSRRVIRNSYNDMLTSSQRSGIFDADDVAKMRIAQDREFDKADLAFDIQNIPDQVENRKKSGAYKSLSSAEVEEASRVAKNMAERNKKQDELAVKESQISNEIGLMTDAANGKYVDISTVSQMVGSGEIRQDVGQEYIRFISSPFSVDSETDSDEYVKMASLIFDAGNKEHITTLIKNTLRGGADGKINRDDLQNLIALANAKNNDLLSPVKDGAKQGSMWDGVSKKFEAVKAWVGKVGADRKQEQKIMSDFVSEINNSKGDVNIDEVYNKVVEKAKVDINPNKSAYQKDQTISLPDGRVVMVVGFDEDGEPLVELVK
jgi:hypothetical protein